MKKAIVLLIILISALAAAAVWRQKTGAPAVKKAAKVYWFIPDGMRADPEVFDIYQWAEEGKLPNIKKLMDNGAYGFSIPDFPSHTPTNFASLLTGSRPKTHGIADGPMHIEGYPLAKPSVAGFASAAKKVPPAWKILEDAGKKVVLLAIPGSTPPELKNGITIRGRWAPWGFDTPAVIFEPKEKLPERKEAGKAFKLFFLGQKLTEFIDKAAASGWQSAPQSFSPPLEAKMTAYGISLWAFIYDAANDAKTNYDSVLFSFDKTVPLAVLKQGKWSEWAPVKLKYKEETVDSDVKIKLIKLWDNGNFRIRLFFNNVNRFLAEPAFVAGELAQNAGPMVDFVDNWPAQLVYEEEDKATFFEEAEMSLDWHKRAAGFILKKYKPDAFIQDTYTPNQMLESRWWHKRIDRERPDYDEESAKDAWQDIFRLYKKLDDIVGEAMKNADENTLIILSSDHGVLPLYKQVNLNNLFAKKGWLKFAIDEKTGEPSINWDKTKVVYLKMAYVYINPDGLGGNWKRGSGPEYEALRDEVIKAVSEIADDNGIKPLVRAVKREDAEKFLELPPERIGDIVLEVVPRYQWWEEVTADGKLFSEPLGGGYKQAINPKTTKAMWTPFVISGPGVKKGVKLAEPVNHIDQLPTILKLLGVEIPGHVEGRPVSEILE